MVLSKDAERAGIRGDLFHDCAVSVFVFARPRIV